MVNTKKRLTIGIDISMLVYRGSGVANYTYNLVKHLLEYDKTNEYRLFYSSLRRPPNFYYLDEFRRLGAKVYDYPLPPWALNWLWNKHHLLPVEWLIGKVDYYFSSDFLRPPLLNGTKGITTIHDLTWKVFPQFHTEDIVKGHERKLQQTIKGCDIIIVDSQNTKKDLLKYYPAVEKTNRVEVIYPGIDDRFRVIKDKEEVKKVLAKYNIKYPGNYLLYVGAIEPRKNLDTAIKVFADFIKDKKYSDYEFLIVGRAGWKNEQIFQLVHNLKLQDKVRFVGFVEDEDLPYFYNASKVFIYLSLYEGFGLPPVEAAACGIPTLMYDNSSLRELFNNIFPYALKGTESKTLNKLIGAKAINSSFSWETHTKSFLHLLEE